MPLSRSAHADTFARDRLPPEDQWPELTFDLPELEYPDRLNCAQRLVDDAIERYGPDRRALLTASTEWTYGDLRDNADRVAALLAGPLGLQPGNRVLVRAPNNPWLVAIWLGILKAGGVVVLTMPLLRASRARHHDRADEPQLAICDHRFRDALEEARSATQPTGHGAYGGGGADDLVNRAQSETESSTPCRRPPTTSPCSRFTSGTTGRPKVTMHFHRDVLAIADTFSRHVLRPDPSDLFTTTAPFAFTFGLGAGLVFPLHAGAATLLIETGDARRARRRRGRHGVTVLFTAPTAYKAMVGAGRGRSSCAGYAGRLRR